MALSPGTRFGSYEIAGEIGAGGMGVVYRATDTKLKRDVAVKVLPESLATDAERLTRFQREAEVLASLNHPNIAQIYGIEESDGRTALILELVEGPTLADRISRGALPADEALGTAMQIAEALEAAHSQGIVHRDLKPANIKLRPDGTVKVLDFGIAKALEPENLTTGPQSPMLTTPATQVGVILGTAAYMSPEQAKGQPVDQRTDIWAFGCLLYEMLTGQLAFGAEDVPTTLARVIANETNLDSLPATISPAVRHTVKLCLRKEIGKRVADIRDVRLALAGEFGIESSQLVQAVADARPIWRRAFPVAAAILVTGIVVGLTVSFSIQPEPRMVDRFDYDIPEGQSLIGTNRRLIALSPDGRQFVYLTTDGAYLRAMDELEARLIPGIVAGALAPSISPDGQSMAYYDFPQGQLKRIAISGGAPVVVGGFASNVFGVNWEVDGTVLVGQIDGIYRVSANGGTPELVISVSAGDFPYGPRLLPDGDSVLFSVTSTQGWDDAQIVAQSISTGERTLLVEGGSDARYLSTGHLIYALGDGLFALNFDADSLTVSGGPVPLIQGVMRAPNAQTGVANYDVSEDGTLVYVAGSVAAVERTLVWVDREGREEPIGAPARSYTSPRISPDGTKVALNPRDEENDIWIWDLARETLTRLTFDPGADTFPVWSPDSQRIAFSSTRNNGPGLLWRAADGSGPVESLADSDGQIFPETFLPDGTGILVRGAVSGAEDDDIAIVLLEGESDATPLLQTTFRERNSEVSPDGSWLAYASNESGREEIYVRPFPDVDSGGRWQVSTGGGTQPLWARSGEEIFYRSGEALMAVAVQTEPSFVAGNPEVVFEGQYAMTQGGRTYDVSADGERFLMMRQVESSSGTAQIIVVQNWFEELNRLASLSD